MSSAPTTGNGGNGGISKWSTWGRARRAAATPTTDQDSEGSYIPLADLRSTECPSKSLRSTFGGVVIYCVLIKRGIRVDAPLT